MLGQLLWNYLKILASAYLLAKRGEREECSGEAPTLAGLCCLCIERRKKDERVQSNLFELNYTKLFELTTLICQVANSIESIPPLSL
jgi:hypothetical protein